MKTHYSAAELAAMKLPGLPGNERRMRDRASKDGWASRQVACKGGKGGMRAEYAVTSLPKATKIAIVQHLLKSSPSGAAPSSAKPEPVAVIQSAAPSYPAVALPKATELKDWQRECASARLGLLNELARLTALLGCQETAIAQLVGFASTDETIGRLASLANNKQGESGHRTLSATTLKRWKSAIAKLDSRSDQFVALAPKHTESMRVPAYAPYLLPLFQQPQKPTLKKALLDLENVLPEGVALPSYWSAQRFLDKMSKLDLARGRMLPRELKNVRAFVRRDTSHMWPGDAYTADGHTFDAEVAHPRHGKPFRPEITSVLDIATRKSVGWSVDLAESTWAVLDALRCAVETWGVPSIFYVDNGSGYKNELMNGVATGFMDRLGISLTHSLPYNSQARGIIERSHQTLWVTGAKELPTYMGATMDREAKQSAFKITRRDINSVGTSRLLMRWDEFVLWCKARVDAYNNHPHRGLPKMIDPITGKRRHQTPNEAWDAALAQKWEPVMLEEAETYDLFRPYKECKTTRGEIRLHGNTYFHKDLEHYHGEKLHVGYDIRNAELVWVRELSGRLICLAGFEANKTHYFPVSQLEVAAEKRAQGRIKRASAKIEEAEQELRPPQVIEHHSPEYIHHEDICIPHRGVPAIQAEPLPDNAEYLPVPRPVFTTDAAKYRWLRTNASQKTEQDERWLDYYCSTDEFDDLFGGSEEVAAQQR